mmetsp:Transcript_43440/g.105283  ORF Transcript_43440/g.105283 Transcript_43440/m.105283 type:complete len:151 (+) Transcript_43440:99-551(+)|eukprot:CAMPEP_0113500486 /NCGR_PEP_ID=MMETSP0014_2-20120614/32359_1 /TAXON_ID=2857 /ORGANISM="Nitzschia sp." /LENGTH=150 /DNA_ID=CAMNT_0000394835 /DNA_START=94 /DNA_END=546 /DNA_ORIENTATION=+ /assembly_acc=CAM_ASM_000159
MPTTKNVEYAKKIATEWAEKMTSAGKGGPIEPLKALFSPVVYVVLQSSDGGEVEFTLGDEGETTMTWDQFAESAFKDLEAQQYEETTSNCLGVLGNRLILETGRINKSGELYLTATSIVEFNDDGLIVGFESFNEVSDSTVEAASAAQST